MSPWSLSQASCCDAPALCMKFCRNHSKCEELRNSLNLYWGKQSLNISWLAIVTKKILGCETRHENITTTASNALTWSYHSLRVLKNIGPLRCFCSCYSFSQGRKPLNCHLIIFSRGFQLFCLGKGRWRYYYEIKVNSRKRNVFCLHWIVFWVTGTSSRPLYNKKMPASYYVFQKNNRKTKMPTQEPTQEV